MASPAAIIKAAEVLAQAVKLGKTIGDEALARGIVQAAQQAARRIISNSTRRQNLARRRRKSGPTLRVLPRTRGRF